MADDDKKDDDNVVPEPEKTTPDPESTPPTVPEPEQPNDDLREIVSGLANRVEELTATVTALAESGQDTTPVKPPWTHRRLF